MSVVLLGSTSGSVTLQEPAVAGSTVIDLPATSGTMAVLPTATSVLPEASGGTGTTTGYYGFKNRIINGAMVIDQRNAGASVTPIDGQFSVDRWRCGITAASKFSVQQNAGAVTPPAGFTNYLGITSLSAYSVGVNDTFDVDQQIEGFNCSDLAWGTASAQTVTLSFWVRSSLTGTFGGVLMNNGYNRRYVFSYTISSANTWEQKTITVPGDTSGTWLTNNGVGIRVIMALAVGTNNQATSGSWGSSFAIAPTGQTSVVGTNGATFYITGVQLEKGSTATSFDYRPYGTELALCQRYYVRLINNINQELGGGWLFSTTQLSAMLYAPVPMRSTPTIISSSGASYYIFYRDSTNDSFNSITIEFANASNTAVSYFNITEISGTAGQAGLVRAHNASASVALSSEL